MKETAITEVEGFSYGNSQNLSSATGCTVVICREGASAGVDVRGGAPGTRETDLLNPQNMIDRIHAVVLSGGSAFGLDAASGAMQYLEEAGIGFDVGITKVPIVCSAVLYDLNIGDYKIRPDRQMGYDACIDSEKNGPLKNGNFGAGTGATVGKLLGLSSSMKGGIGSYCEAVGDLKVGAIVAVNCLGDVVDSSTGKIIAGLLSDDKKSFLNTEKVMSSLYCKKTNVFNGNTTIGVVVTNAQLTKSEANKVASMAHNGYARAIHPCHTMADGDTIFAMASNKVSSDVNVVGFLAAAAVEKAIVRAVESASSLHGYICKNDLKINSDDLDRESFL